MRTDSLVCKREGDFLRLSKDVILSRLNEMSTEALPKYTLLQSGLSAEIWWGRASNKWLEEDLSVYKSLIPLPPQLFIIVTACQLQGRSCIRCRFVRFTESSAHVCAWLYLYLWKNSWAAWVLPRFCLPIPITCKNDIKEAHKHF